jgi:hypothetical protein
LPLKARLATTSDFPAYERSRVVVIKSPVEWSHGDAFISPQTLRHLGFVAAAVANMQTISVQRRAETSLDSANRAIPLHRRRNRIPARVRWLANVAIQALRGDRRASRLRLREPATGGGSYEVVFVDGPFFYDLIALTIDPTKSSPSASQTAAAAARWYHRVRGRPAP